MTWLDYAVLGVAVISVGWGIWHGLVREVISLGGWVLAFLAANLFAGPLGELLPDSIPHAELKVLIGFVAIFIVVLAVATMAGVLLSRMLKKVGLGTLDRTLGGVFGLVRAVVIAVAFALVAGLTRLPLAPMWKDSYSGPPLGRTAIQLKPWLPPALAERLRYH
jgi:membrane protein required for colicin V production